LESAVEYIGYRWRSVGVWERGRKGEREKGRRGGESGRESQRCGRPKTRNLCRGIKPGE
jgi:hypothetical protein